MNQTVPEPAAFKAEPFHSVDSVRRLFFPSRSTRWIRERIKSGDLGEVVRDGGGWLIPESGVLSYLERHRLSVLKLVRRPDQRNNLLQFQTR